MGTIVREAVVQVELVRGNCPGAIVLGEFHGGNCAGTVVQGGNIRIPFKDH